MTDDEGSEIMAGFLGWIIALAALAGPVIVHIVWCINAAAYTGSAIALLIAGLVITPIGWLHGVSVIIGLGGWVG